MDIFTTDFILKFLGRAVFCLLLVALYRLYKLFSSPLTRAKHRVPMILFGLSVFVSFILLSINYVVPYTWLSIVVMVFNITITLVFAVYLYHQGSELKRYKSTSEYLTYTRSLDALILKMKH